MDIDRASITESIRYIEYATYDYYALPSRAKKQEVQRLFLRDSREYELIFKL